MKPHSIDRLRLFAVIAGCEVVGSSGAIAAQRSLRSWYSTLRKPPFNPPSWVFGPVWSILYALMGIAIYLVHHSDSPQRGRAEGLFGFQFACNAIWSWLFFGLRSPLAALVDIGALWIALAATIVSFFRISRLAALLLVPYLLWSTFAAALNLRIWQLNR